MRDSLHPARGERPASSPAAADPLVGDSQAFRNAIAQARRLASTDLPLLIIGETGTGKELLAAEIHRASGRQGSLVDVNCAAIPRDMVESLLFGHRRGAFTSAHDDSRGLVEEADRGSLFLDELQSLSLDAQPKLLRFLESGEVRRLGETHKRRVRVRTVAAAHPAIMDALRSGAFRNDLMQRLAGAVIRLPTLAERPGDIRVLARHFAARLGLAVTDDAIALFENRAWPGNVRELRMVIERAACLSETTRLSASTIGASLEMSLSMEVAEAGYGDARALPTRERLLAALASHDWNVIDTAQSLGLGRTTLFKHLRHLRISLRSERTAIEHRI